MASFLSTIGQIVTASIDWMMEYLDVIIATPALTVICIAVPIVTVTIDLVKRLIRL